MGRITTHVLDLTRGRPAAGLTIELWRVNGDARERIGSARTNADGRTDAPMLEAASLPPGVYELIFRVGDYFAAAPPPGRFLDAVPIRFTVADPAAHYHVPLLTTPWAYSTYRGS